MAGDDGLALIYTLFAVLVIGGLATLFVARALFETRSTARNRDFEVAIHTAEAGAEELIAAINGEGETFAEKVITEGPPPGGGPVADHVYDTGTMTDEEWAVALAEADWDLGKSSGSYTSRVITTREGQAFAIRPKKSGVDEAEDIVFGVSFVPDIETADRIERVIRMRIAKHFFRPRQALLTGGNLEFGGNAEIIAPDCDPANPDPVDCDADVHANGDVTITGSANQIQGKLTASGTVTGTADTTGGQSGGEEPIPVPPIRARDFYDQDLGDPDRYDLCPDFTVREPSAAGPCQSTTVVATPCGPGATHFRGWSCSGSEWKATDIESGVFYVHQKRASIQGSVGTTPQDTSVFVESKEPLSDTGGTLDRTGSLTVTGNPLVRPGSRSNALFIADRDLHLNGTPGGDCSTVGEFSGFIANGEQLKTQGTVNLNGAIITQDLEERDDLVKRNTDGLSGTMCLSYDETLKITLSGLVTIEYWNEL